MPDEKSAEEQALEPQPDFLFLVRNLATQVLISLGEFPHPVSKQKNVDLDSARFSIELLAMLQAKTLGNLEDIEDRYLDALLHDLRVKYDEATRK